jgi:hypothetical protein
MPAGLQTQGVFSLDWRVTTLPPLNTTGTILQTNNIANFFAVALSNLGGKPTIQLSITGANGNNTFFAWHTRAALDALWHRDAFAFDTDAQVVKWLADGTAVVPTTQFTGGGWAANFTGEILVGATGVIGRNLANPYIGDMADLTLWAGGYADPTDPAILPKFYDATNEVVIRIGPTGWRTLEAQGIYPQLCLSGPASQFLRNLAAGSFTFIPGGYTDTNPTSMFTVSEGTLVTAASDPLND